MNDKDLRLLHEIVSSAQDGFGLLIERAYQECREGAQPEGIYSTYPYQCGILEQWVRWLAIRLIATLPAAERAQFDEGVRDEELADKLCEKVRVEERARMEG